jgi:hypothetical protein
MPQSDAPKNPTLSRQSNRFLRTSRVVRNLNAAVARRASAASSGDRRASRKWVLQQPPTADDEARLSVLAERLEEILIMELHRDGYAIPVLQEKKFQTLYVSPDSCCRCYSLTQGARLLAIHRSRAVQARHDRHHGSRVSHSTLEAVDADGDGSIFSRRGR